MGRAHRPHVEDLSVGRSPVPARDAGFYERGLGYGRNERGGQPEGGQPGGRARSVLRPHALLIVPATV
jgi:hypothetical protein